LPRPPTGEHDVRVIIAGSRGISDAGRLNRAIRASHFDITYVISGGAAGVDQMGRDWARRQDPKVPVMLMPARWDEYGKRAGMIRNCEMAKEADALIAIWDGVSAGTRHMIEEAVGKGLHHYIDASCSNCWRTDGVAIYRFVQPKGPLDQLRAMCRSCLLRRGADVVFFDVFKMWGNHTLHVTERRMKFEQPETPDLKFGEKAKAVRKVKKWRELPPESEPGLFQEDSQHIHVR
jgi:SLOG family YspA-like protein